MLTLPLRPRLYARSLAASGGLTRVSAAAGLALGALLCVTACTSSAGAGDPTATALPPATTAATSSALAWVNRQSCEQITGDTILPELSAASGGEAGLLSSGGFSGPFLAFQCVYQTGSDASTNSYFVVAAVRDADGGRPAAEANFSDARYTMTRVAGESIYSHEGTPLPDGPTTSPGEPEAVAATVTIVSDDAFVTASTASGGAEALARVTAWAHDIDSRMHVQPPITAQATTAPSN